ncbi:hypothetical protein GCM10010168_57130 [Actinoplanes ianthinogenes]|uniref:DUF3349 domain-containing protein n=1 Tax=Actinoplanes ianthinogenes TaxID=122358 RepID=A0ABM7M2M4_9ACTN|nr:DUF3349 domain-containing protein [Actinoplanes ianthinogenes]BCJ45867.1 hypothetical protein Aiant_65240 [Actinoplanes ianthinogenes]GGR31478.1 hypothetical protein GCM10010168_57130 [Actinoplanes ianthinogenes]
MSEQRSNFLARAVEWLRAGYPEGVPRRDYVVLLGLLRRKLTEDEIRTIARELAAQTQPGDGPITAADIEEMISDRMLQDATPADVVRVSAHLAAGGWPLADPPPE